MTCNACNKSIGECTCPDRDESLKRIAWDKDAFVAFKWCRVCDKHYMRCRCETPDFYIIAGGIEQPVHGLKTITGKRIDPNILRQR